MRDAEGPEKEKTFQCGLTIVKRENKGQELNDMIDCYNYSKKSAFAEVIIVNEFNEYVRETFSAAGDIATKSMMGGYLVYYNGKLIGDIGGKELFLKRTPTSDRLLAGSELRYKLAAKNPIACCGDESR